MRQSQPKSRLPRRARAQQLFIRADKEEAKGNLHLAFRLFLAGAKLGEEGCQLNLGNYYDDAKGVRRNREAALYWYKRAYRHGCAAAASNIGVLWRNEGRPRLALEWFKKAARLGDMEANLEIAKYYLHHERDLRRAIRYLRKVRHSNWVSEAGADEATRLLKQAKKRLISR